MPNDFQNSSAVRLSGQFVTEFLSEIPPYTTHVITFLFVKYLLLSDQKCSSQTHARYQRRQRLSNIGGDELA